MRVMKTAVVIVLAHLGSTAAVWSQESQLPSTIALGDIHGDFRTFRKLLNDAGLIDQQGHWSGGRQHLIQTGDIVDRGPDSRRALDLLMRLEQEAAAAGGKVVVTMGNHELWNLIGDYYYLSKGEYAAFAKDDCEPATVYPAVVDAQFLPPLRRLLTPIGIGFPLVRSGINCTYPGNSAVMRTVI